MGIQHRGDLVTKALVEVREQARLPQKSGFGGACPGSSGS